MEISVSSVLSACKMGVSGATSEADQVCCSPSISWTDRVKVHLPEFKDLKISQEAWPQHEFTRLQDEIE